MLKKILVAAAIAIAPVLSFAKPVVVEVSVECASTDAVLNYLGHNNAELLASEKIKTESGEEAMDYVVYVDGKLVSMREVPSTGLTCILSEVRVQKNKGKNGNV